MHKLNLAILQLLIFALTACQKAPVDGHILLPDEVIILERGADSSVNTTNDILFTALASKLLSPYSTNFTRSGHNWVIDIDNNGQHSVVTIVSDTGAIDVDGIMKTAEVITLTYDTGGDEQLAKTAGAALIKFLLDSPHFKGGLARRTTSEAIDPVGGKFSWIKRPRR